MDSVHLTRHVASPDSHALSIVAQVRLVKTHRLSLQYTVDGDTSHLRIPDCASPHRAEHLWQHTCFEAFIAIPKDDGYFEFNFAPSGEWAVYRFDSYRNGMRAVEALAPIISTQRTPNQLTVKVAVELPDLIDIKNCDGLRIALCAVIEDDNGALSYWALAHPPGKPDFHHRDSFAITLNPLKSSV